MKLIIEDDEGRKTVVPFVRDEITIGRQEGNTIRLTERNVSRRHARLLRQNGHILVEDLGSYNGIRINGDRIQGQVQVNEGDLIQIGDYDLAVQREASEGAVAAPAAHHDKTHEVEAHHARGNGASASAATRPLPDNGATIPVLPTVEPGAAQAGEEPEEADPDDVTLQPQAAPLSEEAQAAARRQSTAIIRMDQVEQNRPRQIADIDAAEAPRLIILNTELVGREYSCVRTELKVGRTDENDIAIDHRSLSRTHCKIVREDSGEWRVIDMQSANGLMVNGESYAQSALRNGDVLELGHVKMKFVGAGEKYDAADAVADAAGGGKMGVFIAVGVVALCVIVGGGFAYMKYGTKATTKIPPVVDPNPNVKQPKVDHPQQPEELTPEQQRAQIEAKLKDAREKIDTLDWAGAAEILKTCYVGESMHPEAQRLLVALKEEEPLRSAIEKADHLIDADKLQDAKESLDSAAHSKFLQKRFAEVSERLGRATERKLLQAKAPEPTPKQPTPPQPQPVPVKPPPPPPPATKGSAELLEEARGFNKNKEYAKSKVVLDKCIKAEPKNADCWKLMGVTLGQLGDGAGGARAYEKFLEIAPDHPQAAKVRQIVDAYRGQNK